MERAMAHVGRSVAAYAIAIALASGGAAGAGDGSRSFDPLCMRLDLEVIGFIERHGEAGDISAERLGKAGLQFVAARVACLDGRVEEGAALYRDILRIESVVVSGQK
jgi:hypothetical protein